jgi:hypothetical protein
MKIQNSACLSCSRKNVVRSATLSWISRNTRFSLNLLVSEKIAKTSEKMHKKKVFQLNLQLQIPDFDFHETSHLGQLRSPRM